MIFNRDVKRKTDTTQADHRIWSGFTRIQRFDDQLDLDAAMSNRETWQVMVRGLKLMRYAPGLFYAKWGMRLAYAFVGLFVAWFFKVITDHVILDVPLVVDEVNFPPHFVPILYLFEGMSRMEMMLTMTLIFTVLLILIGTRAEGTGASLYEGTDNAGRAENAISRGGSEAGGLFGVVEFWVDVRLTQRIVNGVRRHLFGRLMRSKMTTIDDHRTGDRIYRVLYDTPMLYTCVTEMTYAPFFLLWGLGTTLYMIWFTYGHLTEAFYMMLCALMFPIVAIVSLPLSKYIRTVTQNQRAAGAATTNAMEETLDNMSAVQSLGAMQKETDKFAERSAHSYWRDRLQIIVWVGIGIVIAVAEWPLGFFLAWLITNQVIEGQMTVGDFGALFIMYMGLRGTFSGIGRVWINLQDQAAAARRVFYFIDYPNEVDDRQGSKSLETIEQGITISNVSFDYPDGRNALAEVNLDINVNEVLAIVGPTGSGKTSLAYLIPSFIEPTAGKVEIDGTDLHDLDLDSLRDQITYVFQEHKLFSESIRSNLLLANPSATEDDIYQALDTAGCMEFVSELPDGIDTVLGKAGDSLSVGQQQRISIARGLIRDAKILILDEPTAALDPHTENALVDSLRRVSENRIVIVIAHRLSTIRRADKIVFLDDGRVADYGSHEELMANEESPYRAFVELQSA